MSVPVISVRPKIAELVYQVYGRTLHPELFVVQQSRVVARNGYEAAIQITNAGHIVTWKYNNLVLTEVASGAHPPLPLRRRLMSYRLKGERTDQIDLRPGVRFETRVSLEPADAVKLAAYRRELTFQATKQGMLEQFQSSGRFDSGALSYVNIDSRDKVLCIQAFHTFPDDNAVLKVQSWYRVASA